MIHDVEKAIVTALVKTIDTYPDVAPQSATYPYAVVSCRRLSVDDRISQWITEINVWDKHIHNSQAEAKADAIEKVLDFDRLEVVGGLICLFKAQRDDITDPDETIKRVRIQFSTTIYESEA